MLNPSQAILRIVTISVMALVINSCSSNDEGLTDSSNDEGLTDFREPAAPREAPTLTVVIQPAQAVSGGAEWQLDDDGVWRDSGLTVTGLSNGDHFLRYKKVETGPCTVTPPIGSLTLYDDQQTRWPVIYRGDGCN